MIRHQFTRGMGPALAMLVVVALIAGCGLFNPNKDDGDITPPATGDRLTPDHLISYFALVQADPLRQADPNAEEYGRCLHPQYGFFFTDLDQIALGEDSWGKERDVLATKDLFGAAMSMTVTMTPEGGAQDTVECDPSAPEDSCFIYSVLLSMSIVAPHPEPPHEVTTFRVNGRAEFVITRDTTDSTLFVIREIHDRTDQPVSPSPAPSGGSLSMAAAASNEVTWGTMRHILAENERLGLSARQAR